MSYNSNKPTYVHALILAFFSTLFGAMLAFTDLFTDEPIKQRRIEDLQNSLVQVLPPSIYDNNPALDIMMMPTEGGKEIKIYRATKAGQVTGVAYETYGQGYAGQIKIIMGVDPEGKILGVRAVQHKETPGLGDKIEPKKTPWILQFNGLALDNPPVEKWKVKKDGGQFDQFSGATITPRAVVTGIRKGLEFFAANKPKLLEAH
ncbi:MAG: electron transport complex subunit RsxG [Rhodospirillales bacterium]|nr:electron transport complex subunit RsxG [Rhodospirillales bacterium]